MGNRHPAKCAVGVIARLRGRFTSPHAIVSEFSVFVNGVLRFILGADGENMRAYGASGEVVFSFEACLCWGVYFLSREKVPYRPTPGTRPVAGFAPSTQALTALVAQKRNLTSARGNRKSGDSPGPRRGSSRSGERLHRVAALVAEDSFEFPLTRKESSAKSPHGFFWRSRCSRWGLRGMVGPWDGGPTIQAFPSGEGVAALVAVTDEVVPPCASAENPVQYPYYIYWS